MAGNGVNIKTDLLSDFADKKRFWDTTPRLTCTFFVKSKNLILTFEINSIGPKVNTGSRRNSKVWGTHTFHLITSQIAKKITTNNALSNCFRFCFAFWDLIFRTKLSLVFSFDPCSIFNFLIFPFDLSNRVYRGLC